MKLFLYLTDMIVPFMIFAILAYGVQKKVRVYDTFIEGAREGLLTVVKIVPTLIGLITAVGVLRASGFLDFLAKLLEGPAAVLQIPVPLISVILVRIVSGSAAVGLILDIFKEYGPDSLEGTMASIMMGCTETVFYTMSVYFMAAHIRKTRWTLPGALLATAGGIAASIILAEMMVK